MDNPDYTIAFSDLTIIETDGQFEKVEELLLRDSLGAPHWMIETNTTLGSRSGVAIMKIHLWWNKEVTIMEYKPSVTDVFCNTDLISLSQWAQERGWNVPVPNVDLVHSNKDFWKHFWETLVIDSTYLDELYGKRPVFDQEDGSKEKMSDS